MTDAVTTNAVTSNAVTSPYGTDPQEPGSELSGFGGADGSPRVSYLLRVNGVDRPVNGAWIGESLLYVLRERLGLAGAKGGCDQGECGACSVQLDGQLTAACLVPAALAADSEIRTVEGLAADGSASDVQRALAESGAVQCGYCIPGMAMAVHDLLERNHQPTELQAREALCGNLCRCTGYQGALAAIEKVAQSRAEAAEAAEAAAEAAADAAEAAGLGEQAETADAADPDSLADDSLADDLAGEQFGRDGYPSDGYPVDEYPVYSDVEIPGQQQGEAQHIDHQHPDHQHPEPQADPLFGPMDGLNTEQPPAEQQYAYPVYAQQPQPEPYQAGFQPQAYPQAEYPLPGTQPPGAPEGAEPGVYVLPHQGTHQNTHAPEAGA